MAVSKVEFDNNVLIDLTSDTVTAGKMLSGTTAHDSSGEKVTGNIASKSSSNLTVSGATVTAPAGYYASAASKSVATGSVEVSASGTANAPTIAKTTTTASGATNVGVATSATPPGSGFFVSNQATAPATTITVTPTHTDGYITDVTNKGGTMAAKTGSVYYTTVKSATTSKTDATATATAGTASVTTDPTASASVSATGFTAASSATSHYVTASASSNSGKMTATGGSASVTASSASVTAGYTSGVSTSTSAKSASGDTVTSTPATASDSKTIYIPDGSVSINNTSLSVSPAVTPTATASASGTNISLTPASSQPSSGRYVTVTGGNSKTTGSAASGESATVTKTAGYIESGTSTISSTATATANANSTTKYYTVPSSSVSVSDSSLAVSGSVTPTVSTSATGNISLTEKTSQPTSGYYVTASGSSTEETVSPTGESSTVTWTAGYLDASTSSTQKTIGSSGSFTANANSATKYYQVPTAGISVSGGGLSKGTASGGGLSGGALSGGGLTAGSGEVSLTAGDGHASVTAAPAVTPKVNRSYTVSGASDTTYGVTSSKPTSGNYMTIDPDGDATNGTASGYGTVKGQGRGSVSRATISRGAVTRAAFSQTVSKAAVTDTRTEGYLPARSSTTIVSADSSTVSLGEGSIAADSIAATSGTSNWSSESSKNSNTGTCTITPTVNAGTTYYIPVVNASATNGTASASASIAKQPSASTTESSASATTSYASTNMVNGISSSATDYWIRAAAESTSGTADAASGYSTASASATGGNASVSKGITSGASASGQNASDSKSSTEVTAHENAKTASDSKTLYLKKATASVTKGTASASATAGSTSMSGLTSGTYQTSATSGYTYSITATGGNASASATGGNASVTAGYTDSNLSQTGDSANTGTKTGTSSTVYLVKGTITNNTSGGSSSGTINFGKQILIGKGYQPSDLYYTAQAPSGNKALASAEADQTGIDVSAYSTASISGVGTTYVGSGISRRDSSSLSASGATVSVPAGYYASAASKSVATGALSAADSSISGGSFTPTLTYNSTNGNFDYGGSKAASGTAYAKVSTAGYVTSSQDTSKSLSATVSATGTVAKVGTGATITGTTTKAPTLERTAKPSGDTWTDAASGDATTAKPDSGVYVQIDAAANTGTLTATPKVTSAGYGTTTAGQYSAEAATATVGAAKATTAYVPITTGSATTPTASGASTSTSLSGTTLTVARSVTPNVSAGWVSSGTAGTVTITGTVPTETKTATANGDVSPSSGKLLSKVTVAIPDGTITNNTSGGSSSGTINRGSQIKIGKGYYASDLYYTAQADAHSAFTPSTTYFQTSTSGAVSSTAVIPANQYATSAQYLKAGSAKTPATTKAQSTPSISVSDSGLITANVAQTSVSVTPAVTAGWVSSGTAGTVTMSASSNTQQLATHAGGQVIANNPITVDDSTTLDTTIPAGTYLTGDLKSVMFAGRAACIKYTPAYHQIGTQGTMTFKKFTASTAFTAHGIPSSGNYFLLAKSTSISADDNISVWNNSGVRMSYSNRALFGYIHSSDLTDTAKLESGVDISKQYYPVYITTNKKTGADTEIDLLIRGTDVFPTPTLWFETENAYSYYFTLHAPIIIKSSNANLSTISLSTSGLTAGTTNIGSRKTIVPYSNANALHVSGFTDAKSHSTTYSFTLGENAIYTSVMHNNTAGAYRYVIDGFAVDNSDGTCVLSLTRL